MFKNRNFIYLILGIIFIIAFALRFNKLSSVPTGFHIDEASLGYNAYSLLLTGKDDNNHAFPLYIDIFGDNRPSGYHFLDIFPVKLFGLNEFATRFPSAFFGAITIFAFYLLSYVIFRNQKISLLSALLIAVAPWNVVLSRASAETIVALFFIILGFSFVIKSLQSYTIKHLLLGTIILSVSYFFYHTPRVFVPLLFLLLIVFLFSAWYRQNNVNYKVAIIGSFLYLCIVSAALIFLVSGGTGRFSQVNIFGDPGAKLILMEQLTEDGIVKSGIIENRIFHNKLSSYFLKFTSNYLEYFSGEFLFVKGGLPIWYVVPRMGLIYLIELPFLLIGLIYLVISKKNIHKIPLLWLFSAPITAAITIDDIPNIQRAIVMFPAIELIAAYGFITFLYQKSFRLKIILGSVAGILLLFNTSYFLHQYFVNATVHKTWYRNNGFKEMIKTVQNSYSGHDKIIVTKSAGGIYPLVLFYTNYNPKLYQNGGSSKDKDYTGFGNFYFVPQGCPSVEKDDKFPKVIHAIYVDKGDCPLDKSLLFKKYSFIYREDGTKAFRIVYE